MEITRIIKGLRCNARLSANRLIPTSATPLDPIIPRPYFGSSFLGVANWAELPVAKGDDLSVRVGPAWPFTLHNRQNSSE